MKGDGHAGGSLLLTERSTVPYRKSSASDKRFTMIRLTALDVQPVLCVLVLQGKKPNLSVETGIDIRIKPDGNPNDVTFFFKNSGERKFFPGAPVCQFHGKKILALSRWNESATMTSNILVDVLKTLDCLDVVKRVGKKRPFLLIDGHKSRLEMLFLQYINTPVDHWVVCLGVPYGTALWQVGDSKE